MPLLICIFVIIHFFYISKHAIFYKRKRLKQMNILSINNLSKIGREKPLFTGVTFGIQ